MRETRLSGSEGGGTKFNRFSLPLSVLVSLARPHRVPSKSDRIEGDPLPTALRSPLSPRAREGNQNLTLVLAGSGSKLKSQPSPSGRGGTARRWVRGLFPPDALMAIKIQDTRDFDGVLRGRRLCLTGAGAEWQDETLRQARFCTPYAPGFEIATISPCAEVAELADALHSGCSSRQGVEVRVLSSAFNPLLSIA